MKIDAAELKLLIRWIARGHDRIGTGLRDRPIEEALRECFVEEPEPEKPRGPHYAWVVRGGDIFCPCGAKPEYAFGGYVQRCPACNSLLCAPIASPAPKDEEPKKVKCSCGRPCEDCQKERASLRAQIEEKDKEIARLREVIVDRELEHLDITDEWETRNVGLRAQLNEAAETIRAKDAEIQKLSAASPAGQEDWYSR